MHNSESRRLSATNAAEPRCEGCENWQVRKAPGGSTTMKNSFRRKEPVPQRPCLFITLACCVTISLATTHKARAVQASGDTGQQLLELGKPITRQITEGQTH